MFNISESMKTVCESVRVVPIDIFESHQGVTNTLNVAPGLKKKDWSSLMLMLDGNGCMADSGSGR